GNAAAGVGDDEAAAVLMDRDAAGIGVGEGVAHQVADQDVDQSAIGGDDEGGVGLHVYRNRFACQDVALLFHRLLDHGGDLAAAAGLGMVFTRHQQEGGAEFGHVVGGAVDALHARFLFFIQCAV